MKFVWKILPAGDSKALHGQEALAAAMEETKPQEFKEQEKHLKAYFDALKQQNLNEKESANFKKKLEQWDLAGDVEAIRRAGIEEKENLQDPLKRHLLLSSAFLEPIATAEKYTFRVDFKANQMAYWKVGAADMLPPNIAAISVKKEDGSVVSERAIRRINPGTGRIGYYDAKLLEQGIYEYVPVFSGDEITILQTGEMPADGSPQSMKEHIEIYQRGAMQDSASEAVERLYDAKTRTGYPNLQSAIEARRTGLEVGSRGQLAALRASIVAPSIAGNKTVEINGTHYQKLTREFLETNIGATPEQTGKWLINTTFLGQQLGVSPLALPYLKEAESRIKAAGINYKLKPTAGGCQCYNHRGIRKLDGSTGPKLSKHSWGIALDINPGDHPFGQRWEDNDNQHKIPMEMVSIMEDCGFRWGNSFHNADPMHFELNVNPFTSQDLLHSAAGKNGMTVLENFAGNLGKDTRMAWAKANEAPSKESLSEVATRDVRPEGWREVRTNGKVPEKSPSEREVSKVSPESIEASVAKYNDLIYEASEKYGVPANLVKTVIWQESGGRPWLASHAGAGGLMQLMPSVAKFAGIEPVLPLVVEKNSSGRKTYRLDPRDGRMDPRTNIMAGTKLLAGLLKQYNGDIKTALASYNWGSGNVSKYFRGEKRMPEETAFYYKNITGLKERLDANAPRHA